MSCYVDREGEAEARDTDNALPQPSNRARRFDLGYHADDLARPLPDDSEVPT